MLITEIVIKNITIYIYNISCIYYYRMCHTYTSTTSTNILLGMPDTSLSGLRTRIARRVLRSTLSSDSPDFTDNTVVL